MVYLMQEKLFKHTYVCSNSDCDALYEISSRESKTPVCFEPQCQVCSTYGLTLVSVVDVTIRQSTDEQEENEMSEVETNNYNPNAMVTYRVITSGDVGFRSIKVTDLEYEVDGKITLEKNWSLNRERIRQLKDIILEAYEDSSDQETLVAIANLFDIELKKTVNFEGTISFSGTVEVDMTFDDDDLKQYIEDSVEVYGSGDVEVHNFYIDGVDERLY